MTNVSLDGSDEEWCEILIIDESDLELAVEVSKDYGLELAGDVIYSHVRDKDWRIMAGLGISDIDDITRNFRSYLVARIPRAYTGGRLCIDGMRVEEIESIYTCPEPMTTGHLWPDRDGLMWVKAVSEEYAVELNLDVQIDGDYVTLICDALGYGRAPEMLEKYIEFHRAMECPFEVFKNRDLRDIYNELSLRLCDTLGNPVIPDEQGIEELMELLERGQKETFWSKFE